MTSVSAIGPVIDYLLTKITGLNLVSTADGSPPVQVCDGFPGENMNAPDVIAVGGQISPTEEGDIEWAGLGPQAPLDEKLSVELTISCSRGGTEQKQARDAALGIYNAVQAAIRSDITLGGAVRFSQIHRTKLTQSDWQTATNGRIAVIEFHVAYEHRIT